PSGTRNKCKSNCPTSSCLNPLHALILSAKRYGITARKVSGWKSGGQTNKCFLVNKSVGLSKFNYWCAKYHIEQSCFAMTAHGHRRDFQELWLSETPPAPQK